MGYIGRYAFVVRIVDDNYNVVWGVFSYLERAAEYKNTLIRYRWVSSDRNVVIQRIDMNDYLNNVYPEISKHVLDKWDSHVEADRLWHDTFGPSVHKGIFPSRKIIG